MIGVNKKHWHFDASLNPVVVTFVFMVVCYNPMLKALFYSNLNTIWRISSKMNVLNHCEIHFDQQHPNFDIHACRNVFKVID